ncbi:MAG: ABC transporter substrate-binding protein [Betaproteobacteria bacterium]|nr:ABC transporter substrate-binding protein [Betaproteobacteria bacterium]
MIARRIAAALVTGLVALYIGTAPAGAKTFRFANQGDALSVDPYMHNEAVLLSLTGNVYEGLTGRGKKFELTAELATDWKQTSPTVWRFNLRKGVKFHDGSPFTADDVVFSFERARGEGSDVRVYVAGIREIRKVDTHAVDIVTQEPFAILPQNISRWYIMSKAWCEKHNAVKPVDVRKGTENYASTHANGTGPFMLKTREPGVRTTFAPNPDWWAKAEHNVTEAIFTPVGNDATRVAALISGEIDMVDPVPLQDVPRVKGSPALQIMQSPELRTIFLGMDQKRDELLFSNVKGRNPLKDRKVRQAFYQAIDIEAIRTRIMRGVSTPTGLMVAPGVQGFVPDMNKRLPYDPDGARKLLAEAGYPSGFEVGMNCPNDRYVNDGEICQAIASMLAKVGVKVNLVAEPKTLFFPKVLSRNVSFYLAGWTPTSQDSHNALYALMSTPGEAGQGQFNGGAYSNPRVDDLTRRIGAENYANKRNAMIAEAFKIHQDEIGHIPLHQQPITWGMKKSVEMVQTPDNFVYLRWVTVK